MKIKQMLFKKYKSDLVLSIYRSFATWVFGSVVILFPKKPHSLMRVWVQSSESSQNIRVSEFRLIFLSYIYI